MPQGQNNSHMRIIEKIAGFLKLKFWNLFEKFQIRILQDSINFGKKDICIQN